jgi:hypothetical protein
VERSDALHQVKDQPFWHQDFVKLDGNHWAFKRQQHRNVTVWHSFQTAGNVAWDREVYSSTAINTAF